jgi:hypothetical protein
MRILNANNNSQGCFDFCCGLIPGDQAFKVLIFIVLCSPTLCIGQRASVTAIAKC